MIVTDKLSTESFHAFIDEQLTDEQYVQVEAQLDEVPEKIEEIQQCHIINERLREVFDPIVEEPIPDDLFNLAAYGFGHEQIDHNADDMQDEPVSYLELEDDLAAIDSLDIYPEEMVSESLVDDTDASDLEILAQTEHLSEFDIDNLRSDSSNIIPDIFDDPELAEEDTSGLTDPTDELLESIDHLSIELEKAHRSKHANQLEQELQSAQLFEPETPDQLELEPLDGETEQQLLADVERHYIDEQQAKEKVIETLISDDELTLEPIEEPETATANESILESGTEILEDTSAQLSKSARPRNLRHEQPAESTQLSAGDEIVNKTTIRDDALFTKHSTKKPAIKNSGEMSDESIPEDVVAEFFAENKRADFEVNEVVRQFEEVSDNFGEFTDDHLFEQGSLADIKYRALDLMDNVTARVNDFKAVLIEKKNQLLGKFDQSPLTNFNRSPFDGFNKSLPENNVDTLDLGSFDEFAGQPTNVRSGFTSQNDIHTAPELKKPARKAKIEDPGNTLNSDILDFDAFDDILKAPPKKQKPVDLNLNQEPVIAADSLTTADDKKESQVKMNPSPQPQTTVATGIGVDIDFNDEPVSGGLVNKFGETLKFYKQKIADMRSGLSGENDISGFFQEPSPEANVESKGGLERYKKLFTDALSGLNISGGIKTVAIVSALTGVLLGVVLGSIGGTSGKSINNDRIESLAIDTHLLNSQFNKKIIPDTESAILEKLQWYTARVGHPVRLADIKVEDFEFKKVTVMPTMANIAVANIFENKSGQRMTLFAIPDIGGLTESPVTCRIPAEIDGLCVWIKDGVRYITVANLSLSRVRSFSEQIIEKM